MAAKFPYFVIIWLMAGTAKKRRYIPIGPGYDSLPTNSANTLYKGAETFVCRIYGMDNVDSVDEARRVMFQKGSKQCAAAVAKQVSHAHLHMAVDMSVIPLLTMTGVSMTNKWIG